MPAVLLLLLLTQAAPAPARALWWVTDRGAVPLVCAPRPKGPLSAGAACQAMLGAKGSLALANGVRFAWHGWAPRAIDPWDGREEPVATLTPTFAKPRQLAVSPRALHGSSRFFSGAPVEVGGHRLVTRGPERGSRRPGGWVLVDEAGAIVLQGSPAGQSMGIEAAVDVDGDGSPEVVIVERCVNEERLTVLDGATLAVRFTWGYCGI